MPRIRLPGVVGSPEFNRAYEDALAGRLSNPTLARPAVAAQGTIEALVAVVRIATCSRGAAARMVRRSAWSGMVSFPSTPDHAVHVAATLETIRVVQQKTGEYGRAFTVDGFSGFMRDASRRPGLPLDCQPHGLRKAAGRRLAEAGCSSRELMAVLGHKTLCEAERYTRDADQARLASAAVARLEGRKVNS